MKVNLVIEEGASAEDITRAKKFKEEIRSLYPLEEDIHSIMKRIYGVFPDSSFNGLLVSIAVSTSVKLATPSSMAASLLTLKEELLQ